MEGFNWWPIVAIVAPIVLVVAILWAVRRNRVRPMDEAHTEAATRHMYDEQARDDGMHPERNS